MSNKSKKRKLKWNMIRIMVFAWLIPLILIILLVFFFVNAKTIQHMSEYMLLAEDKAAEICKVNLEDAIADSRNASYMGVIQKSYDKYRKEGNDRSLYSEITNFLMAQYRFNSHFHTAMLMLYEDTDTVYYTKNDTNIRDGFDRYRSFESGVKEKIFEEALDIDTGILFKSADGQLYMARNMMSKDFKPFALLVMELNQDAMFKSLESVAGFVKYEVYADGMQVSDSRRGTDDEGILKKDYDENRTRYMGSYYFDGKYYTKTSLKVENYRFDIFVQINMEELLSEQRTILLVFAVQLLLLIPLVFVIISFFNREVTKPIHTLVSGATEIEKGNLGYQTPEVGNSEEVIYLEDSFNHMSEVLKRQFDTIYSEELALKDAKIRALQSQINPHFLNNTLEIINWEARMNGNYNVSTMIEALSTMLEATMNRNKKQYGLLSEEVDYMNAYLLIASKRYGSKLKVETDIDDSLLKCEVPRLIVEPIVENAVEHGKDEQSNICIRIKMEEREDDRIWITIRNKGTLSTEDKKKIRLLLSGEPEKNDKATNIGIRNVNLRLRMIYGEDGGLTIEDSEDGYTVSRLTLRKELPSEIPKHDVHFDL